MVNLFKSGTTVSNGTIRKNNFVIAVQDGISYGPTSTTGFWAGITPPTSGYTMYTNKSANGPSIFTSTDDNGVITAAKALGGTNINTINDALVWFNGQSDRMVANIDYPSIVTSGMVLNLDAGYVPSYPRTGTTWNDLSGNGNNGTLTNGPTYSSTNGGSIVFDGTDDYVTCGNASNIQTFSQITLNTWVKFSGLDYVGNTGNLVGFMGKGSPDGAPPTPNNGFFFAYDNRLNRSNFTYTCFGNSAGGYSGGGNNFQNKSYVFTNAVWYNITVTVNSSSIGSLFINGTQLGSSNTFSGLTISNTVNNLYVGRIEFTGYNFNGNISQSAIYNIALSAQEVLQNYNALKSRFGL